MLPVLQKCEYVTVKYPDVREALTWAGALKEVQKSKMTGQNVSATQKAYRDLESENSALKLIVAKAFSGEEGRIPKNKDGKNKRFFPVVFKYLFKKITPFVQSIW
jgi:hypothetical protein